MNFKDLLRMTKEYNKLFNIFILLEREKEELIKQREDIKKERIRLELELKELEKEREAIDKELTKYKEEFIC